MRERSRFLRGLSHWVGFRQIGVPYVAPARQAGETKYGNLRMIGLAVDALLAFSTAPLIFSMYVGFALALGGFAYGFYALYARFVTHNVLPGWTSLFMVTAFVGGLQLMMTGVVGLYLGRIYNEVKQRPLYPIRKTWGFPPNASS